MKRSIKMLILSGLLVIALSGYWFTRSHTSRDSSVTEEKGSFALTKKTEDELIGLAWTADDTNYKFTKVDDTWTTGNGTWPVDSNVVQDLADDLSGLTATKKIENVETMADYGIVESSFSVTVLWSDGTSTTYAVGNQTPFRDGYYISLSNSDSMVYIVEDSLSDIFDVTVLDLAQQETPPDVENVTRMTIGLAVDAVYDEMSTTIDPNQHWYDVSSGEALNADDVESLIDDVQDITWNTLVNAYATDDDLSTYVLADDALTVTLTGDDDTALTLLLGGTDDSGDVYARLPDSTMVYTVSSSLVSALQSATTESLRSKALAGIDSNLVRKAVFTAASRTWTVVFAADKVETDETDTSVEAQSLTDEDVSSSTDTSADEGATEEEPALDAAQDLWDAFRKLSVTEYIDAAQESETLLTVYAANTSGMTAEFVFTAYDADNYQVMTNGENPALVSASDVDAIIRMIRSSEYAVVLEEE